MKVLPTKGNDLKLFLLSLGLAFIFTIGSIFQIANQAMIVAYFINLIIYAIVVMVLIRIVLWLGKKMGLVK